MQNLTDYINWKQIVKDHNLKSGDLTPTQEGDLTDIIAKFITTNK